MSAGFDAVHWLVLVQNELLLFSATFFALGALDEVAVDLLWLWGKLTGRIRTHRIDREALPRTLAGRAAVLVVFKVFLYQLKLIQQLLLQSVLVVQQ